MNLQLVKAAPEYREQITDMLDEWTATGEKIVPYSVRRLNYHNFDHYWQNIEKDRPVPDSTFFCLDTESGRVLGAVNIRHTLDASLMLNGGHIGHGVRPSERCKGIGTAIVGMALEECRRLGIRQVLMVCDKNNPASAKTILRNGGALENEVLVDGTLEQRYWIRL